jgi:hypothetical protein
MMTKVRNGINKYDKFFLILFSENGLKFIYIYLLKLMIRLNIYILSIYKLLSLHN